MFLGTIIVFGYGMIDWVQAKHINMEFISFYGRDIEAGIMKQAQKPNGCKQVRNKSNVC